MRNKTGQNLKHILVQNLAKFFAPNFFVLKPFASASFESKFFVSKIFAKTKILLARFLPKAFLPAKCFGQIFKQIFRQTFGQNFKHNLKRYFKWQNFKQCFKWYFRQNLRIPRGIFIALIFGTFAFGAFPSLVEAAPTTIPSVNLSLSAPDTPAQLVTSLNVVVVLTLLILAPSLVLVMTSFMRLAIVFSFLRTALGTQQSPPTQILISLALVLTFFIMEPVGKEAWEKGVKPYIDEKISYDVAFERASEPFKNFMLKNTREKDLALFYRIRSLPNPQTTADVPLTIAIPAFMISELKTAFMIGFLLYLPFLVIDMVVSSILMAMGMMMVPPVMISLPFKVLVFVLVDGFNLLIGSLVQGFK